MISEKKEKLRVAYVPCAKGSWLDERVYNIHKQSLEILKSNKEIEIITPDFVLVSEEDAHKATEFFVKEHPDVLLVHFITFSLGTIVPILINSLNLPVIMWSMPEPEMKGGRIKSNSFCASNMNAHTLYKEDRKYRFIYSEPENLWDSLTPVIDILGVMKNLRKVKIGLVGNRVPGFYTSNFNELQLHKVFGVSVHHVSLLEVVDVAEGVSEDEISELDKKYSWISRTGISEQEYNKCMRLYLSFKKISKKYDIDGFAVKCWPEFGDIFGIGVCAVLGLLIDDGIMCGCEGDVYGTVNMVIGHLLTGRQTFFCDFISFDESENTGVAWHCGAAAPGLCKDDFPVSFCRHSVIDGGDVKGVTLHFPLKPGQVTFSRIGEGKNGFRMLLTTGQGIDTPQLIKGNPLKIKFDCDLKELIGTIIARGFEHHYAVVYKNISKELKDLCYWLDIELIEV